MGVDSVQWAGWAVPPAVARGTAPLEPLMRAVTSVSMSTRGHSHMRGLVPQDGLFGGSGTAGLGNERGSPGEGLLIVPPADSLLTLPSPLGAHQRTISGGCGPRSTALLRRARRRSTWSTRSAASMNDVDR